jgi:hypothetical protein
MIQIMMRYRPRLNRIAFALMTLAIWLFSSPSSALAQDEKKVVDARLEGYPQNVTLDGGSTALTWILLLALTALCVGVLFKSANRTHLD